MERGRSYGGPGSVGLLTRVTRPGVGTLVRAGYRVGVLRGARPEFRGAGVCMDCLARCTPVWRQGFRERGDELFARRVHWRPVGLRKTLYQATGHPSAGTDWGGAHGATGRGDSLDTTACASVRTASLARSTIAAAGGVGRVLAWEPGA